MPTERFHNLCEEKKQRITQAIRAEMSRVSVDEISINKIVMIADIPRGSFYQYFDDKRDVVTYILEDYVQKMEERVLTSKSKDIFDVVRVAFEFTVEYGFREENIDLMKNVFSCLRAGDTGSMIVVHKREQEMLLKMGQRVDMSPLNIKSEQDAFDVLSIILSIMRAEIASVFLHPELKEGIVARLENKFNILKNGMYKREENNV